MLCYLSIGSVCVFICLFVCLLTCVRARMRICLFDRSRHNVALCCVCLFSSCYGWRGLPLVGGGGATATAVAVAAEANSKQSCIPAGETNATSVFPFSHKEKEIRRQSIVPNMPNATQR